MLDKKRIGYCRQMARKIIHKYNIKEPPIDINYILKEKGYVYKEINFPDKLSAILVEEEDSIKYAAVNINHSITRTRFSLAHELGHRILDHDIEYHKKPISLENPPIISLLRHKKTERIFEKEADEFAGEFLVPLEFLKKAFKEKSTDPHLLAKIFNVSSQVMFIRINNHERSLYK